MDKKNLQTKSKISKILLDIISEKVISNDYGARLKLINEKMEDQNKNTFKININDILTIFENNSGNANLYSKMLKILDQVSIKEEILNQGDSEPIRKLFLPLHIQFMLIASLSIYLYGDLYLNIYASDLNLVGDQANIFINTISWAETFIVSYSNENNEQSNEEIELIHEISSYWKDLYKELFGEYQKDRIKFFSEKSLMLVFEILEKLEQDQKILILTERKIEVHLI